MFLPPEKEDEAGPLTVDHLLFAFGLFVIGIAASCLLFIAETIAGLVMTRNAEDTDNDADQNLFYKRKLAMASSSPGSVLLG